MLGEENPEACRRIKGTSGKPYLRLPGVLPPLEIQESRVVHSLLRKLGCLVFDLLVLTGCGGGKERIVSLQIPQGLKVSVTATGVVIEC